MALVTLSGVNTADTPDLGRQKWNLNDTNILAALETHVASSSAHQAAGDTSAILTASGTQTLINKTIDSTTNTMSVYAAGLKGAITTLKHYEHNSLVDEELQDFAYDSSEGGIKYIHVKGDNGIRVDKLTDATESDGIRIHVNKDAVFDYDGGQTLAINTASVVAGEQFKLSGKSTFAGQVSLSTSQPLKIAHASGYLDIDSTVESTSTSTGSIQTLGGLGVAKTIYVGKDINISGLIRDDGAQLHLQDGSFDTYLQNTTPAGTLYLEGYNIQLRDSANTSQYVQADGGNITSTGKGSIGSTADNTLGSTDGSFTTAGGAYVAKNLTIGTGARINSTNTLSFNETTEKIWSDSAGHLSLGAATKVKIANPFEVSDTLTVTGVSTFNNNVTIANTKDIWAANVGGSDLGKSSAPWGEIYVADDKGLILGNGQDSNLKFDGSDTIFNIGVGSFKVTNSSDEAIIRSNQSTAYLDFEGVNKLKTDTDGIHISGDIDVTGDIEIDGSILPTDPGVSLGSTTQEFSAMYLGDNKKLYFGAGQNSYLEGDATDTELRLSGSSAFKVTNTSGQVLFGATQTGGYLSYQGTVKVGATSAGATITGDAIISGDLTTAGAIEATSITQSGSGNITGNADSADKWATARTISLGGHASGSISLDGSANKTLSVTIANDSHTHNGTYYTETESDGRYLRTNASSTTNSLLTISNTTTYGSPLATAAFTGSTYTKKNKLAFTAMSSGEGQNSAPLLSSNDPGFIVHETSNKDGDHNKGVIHICPTDDNSGVDYVSIHGTNDAETVKIYTSGAISTPGTITAGGFSGTMAGPFQLGATLDVNDQFIKNTRKITFIDWNTENGRNDDTVRLLRRDDRLQLHNGGMYFGNPNQGTMPVGEINTGDIYVEKKIYGQTSAQLYQSATTTTNASPTATKGAFVPCVVYALTEAGAATSNNPPKRFTNNGSWTAATGIHLPARGFYRVTGCVDAQIETDGGPDINVELKVKLNGVWVGKSEWQTPDIAGTETCRLPFAETHVCNSSNDATLEFHITMTGMDQCDIKGICVEFIAPCASGYEYKYVN